jgi:hypothetical protein
MIGLGISLIAVTVEPDALSAIMRVYSVPT